MTRMRFTSVAIAALTAMPLIATAGNKQAPTPQLGRYIPEDVSIYVHKIETPGREFVSENWKRVFETAKECGIQQEIARMIQEGQSAEDRAKFNETWTAATTLIEQISWYDLIKGETVFAERFAGIIPDVFFLFKPKPETAKANLNSLVSLARLIADSSQDLNLVEDQTGKVTTWSIQIPDAPISFYVLNKDDVIAMGVGTQGMKDVASLLNREPGVKPITESTRFRDALTHVPKPEFLVSYVNFSGLFGFMQHVLDTAVAPNAEKAREMPAIGFLHSVFSSVDFVDYSVTTGSMEGRTEFFHIYTAIKPEARSKPVCRMITEQKPFESFDKYVPVDATGFSLNTGVDLEILYDLILGLIKDLPEGPAVLTQWEQIQTDAGFSIKDDFFSWFSGEMVQIELPSAVPSPMAAKSNVVLMRVRKPDLAKAKVNAAIDNLNKIITDNSQPSLVITPATTISVEGFRNVTHPLVAMFMLKLSVGVWDDWLVIGTSEDAVNKVINTANGKAKTIAENPRFKKEGLFPKGPVTAASYQDLSNLGQELGAAVFSISFAANAIPDKPETRPLRQLLILATKLGPAVAEIDFFQSSSMVTKYTGDAWLVTKKVNYKPDQKKKQPPSTQPRAEITDRTPPNQSS